MGITVLQPPPVGLGTGDPVDRILGTKTSGPRGVEAIIEYNGLYLNKRDWVDTYVVESIDGLDDADVRDQRANDPADDGETAFPSFYAGRTLVLTGHIRTKTIWKMRDMQQALRAAFADLSQERPLIFRTDDVNTDMQIFCKKSSAIKMTDQQQHADHFERQFQITLRSSKGVFLSYLRHFQQIAINAATVPFVVHNAGDYKSRPVYEFIGPYGTGARLTNNDSEGGPGVIQFTAAVPPGDAWSVDITKRTMVNQAGNNMFPNLDVASDWLKLEKGDNNMQFDSTGYTIGQSFVNVYWYDTYI
jgi:hypothetical protein